MNALLALFIRSLRPANSETRDPLAEDAPSPPHRALRWSLPGAALLSIPVSLQVLSHYLPGSAATTGMPIDIYSIAKLGICVLAAITMWASYRALVCIYEERGRQVVRMALLAVFNLLAIAASVFAMIDSMGSLLSIGLD